jgi:serine/threonine-protein kinase HipA
MTGLLCVSLNDTEVGTLTMLRSGGIFFAFDKAYLESSNRLTLSQSFFTSAGDLIPETKISSTKLPVFFSNLLPEGHMRDYLAQRGGLKSSQEFKLIELLGQDLTGSIIITPIGGMPTDRIHEHEPKAKSELRPLRFSLAGVQLKFSAIAERNGGLIIPANGMGGNWIVKLPAQNYAHVPENEFAIMSLAASVGIPIPKIKLVPLKDIEGLPQMGILAGKNALAVKRFDRAEKNKRIHMEDFAQVYGISPDKKYEGVSYANIAGMIWTLTGEKGLTDFIRRLTFTIMTGNGDMHLKNWSLLYPDGKTPELSPAYDLLSTIPYIPSDGLALKLADTKDMQSIDIAHFRKLAEKAQVPEHLILQTVRDTVDKTRTIWTESHKHYDLPSDLDAAINKHINEVGLSKNI